MWSAEADVLLCPAATFRALDRNEQQGRQLARRLLLLVLTIGCLVSVLASFRISPRLVVDGAISFALIPLFQLGSLALVLRAAPPTAAPGFIASASLFAVGNAPWIAWMMAAAVGGSFVRPTDTAMWSALRNWSIVVPVVWSAWIDFHFFREVAVRTPWRALWDVLFIRAIGWTLFILYFHGMSIYAQGVPILTRWLGL